jgi:hypothetical protein
MGASCLKNANQRKCNAENHTSLRSLCADTHSDKQEFKQSLCHKNFGEKIIWELLRIVS